ncbi:MAG: 3-dehydroquinate synthase [Treponema sp.]|jgi:3-dehydroquinate synthase|nr:3-dehydroquinate synthase [Treponema sp.]
MKEERVFSFAGMTSRIIIGEAAPSAGEIIRDAGGNVSGILAICDEHTLPLAKKITSERPASLCVLPPGEEAKTWESVERILKTARDSGLGRDSLFMGIGGGVVTDLAGFAASVYMRGTGLCFVSTTLLGMVDAAVGGKTGFDLFGAKNLTGTFYPASLVYMPVETLRTLPEREWKSGMAELVKTAVIAGAELFQILKSDRLDPDDGETLAACIARAVAVKGGIVEADPLELGTARALLNLGHTFGHALESSAGLGRISHGEAVAWGMVRACELGVKLGVTPPGRALDIRRLLESYDFELEAPHPFMGEDDCFIKAIEGDKKKKAGLPSFIVPGTEGARIVPAARINGTGGWTCVIKNIIDGAAL